MIGLGLRLTLGGGRETAVRLAVTAVAVALGVGMLLVTLAGINGIKAQAEPDHEPARLADSEVTRPSRTMISRSA